MEYIKLIGVLIVVLGFVTIINPPACSWLSVKYLHSVIPLFIGITPTYKYNQCPL